MSQPIRVSVLDDHPSIIDGYRFRLDPQPDIEIVATATYADTLLPMLADHPTDVLILDIFVPNDQESNNPYPIFHIIPQLLQTYPDMAILAISGYNEHALLKSVKETGVSGYILKDDLDALQNLENVIRTVAQGDVFFSQKVQERLLKHRATDLSLAPRQLEILSLLAANPELTSAAVANKLGVAHSTVRNSLSGAYLRLDVRNRSAAILKARELGFITPFASTETE